MKRLWRWRHAFTLVELLVVIAVISLLMSLLLPALAGAHMIAKRTVCLSNLKATGMGFMIYANDSNGKFISGRVNAGNIKMWPYILVHGYDVYDVKGATTWIPPKSSVCPSTVLYDKISVLSNNKYNSGYALLSKSYASDNWASTRWDFMVSETVSTNLTTTNYFVSRVPKPSSIIMLADTFTTGTAWSATPYDSIANFKLDGLSNYGGAIYIAHGNRNTDAKANVLFFDNHAESSTAMEIHTSATPVATFWSFDGASMTLP